MAKADLSKRDKNAFALARAKAINTYAMVETSMAQLFEYLLQAESRKSYFVFSRLISPRSKRECLTELMGLTYGDKFKEFFPTLMKRVGELDGPRNEIVHWIHKYAIRGTDFDPSEDDFLVDHPNIFSGDKVKIKDLRDFTEKCDFLRQVIFYFCIYLKLGQRPDEPGSTWPGIFQKRCSYPPPTDHPLILMNKKRADPPSPSRE